MLNNLLDVKAWSNPSHHIIVYHPYTCEHYSQYNNFLQLSGEIKVGQLSYQPRNGKLWHMGKYLIEALKLKKSTPVLDFSDPFDIKKETFLVKYQKKISF